MLLYPTYTLTVVIGFSQVDNTIDESAGTVMLSVSVQDGNIPDAETRIITLTTNDGTAQCMLVLVSLNMHFQVPLCKVVLHSQTLSGKELF